MDKLKEYFEQAKEIFFQVDDIYKKIKYAVFIVLACISLSTLFKMSQIIDGKGSKHYKNTKADYDPSDPNRGLKGKDYSNVFEDADGPLGAIKAYLNLRKLSKDINHDFHSTANELEEFEKKKKSKSKSQYDY